jgi:hypothetical protein
MKQPQVCDHCGGRFGMVTHRWWGNKFCKSAKTHISGNLRLAEINSSPVRLSFAVGG